MGLIIFVILSVIAFATKGSSVYKSKPEERNPMHGKTVLFVANENEKENADGAKGHLESTGESNHRACFYEKIIKIL